MARLGSREREEDDFDRVGNTLNVWFDDPKKELICKEISDDVILVKDKKGRVIGFERLNYITRDKNGEIDAVPVEVQMI